MKNNNEQVSYWLAKTYNMYAFADATKHSQEEFLIWLRDNNWPSHIKVELIKT